jgi:hypothetical protein
MFLRSAFTLIVDLGVPGSGTISRRGTALRLAAARLVKPIPTQ